MNRSLSGTLALSMAHTAEFMESLETGDGLSWIFRLWQKDIEWLPMIEKVCGSPSHEAVL